MRAGRREREGGIPLHSLALMCITFKGTGDDPSLMLDKAVAVEQLMCAGHVSLQQIIFSASITAVSKHLGAGDEPNTMGIPRRLQSIGIILEAVD